MVFLNYNELSTTHYLYKFIQYYKCLNLGVQLKNNFSIHFVLYFILLPGLNLFFTSLYLFNQPGGKKM